MGEIGPNSALIIFLRKRPCGGKQLRPNSGRFGEDFGRIRADTGGTEIYLHKCALGQAKKCCICIKYFWARRRKQNAPSTVGPCEKMQYLHNFTIIIVTSKSIGFNCIFSASIVLLHNCCGPGEKVLYLH